MSDLGGPLSTSAPASSSPRPDTAVIRETAVDHVDANVPVAELGETVGAVLNRLRTHSFDYIEDVYVVDERRRLIGVLRMDELLRLGAEEILKREQLRAVEAVPAHLGQEEVARLAVLNGWYAVPVKGASDSFIGVVSTVSLLDILRREHIEDLHRLAGISREVHGALEATPIRRVRDRLPWLLIGFAGSMVATFVASRFEAAMSEKIAIAFFIPAIVYLADAIGTQTEAIAVRALSLSGLRLMDILFQELRTGALIGVALGLVGFPVIAFFYQDSALASTVFLSIVVAGTIASLVGLVFPWIFHRLGKDPAFGAGPVGTVVQDVLSLIVYFTIAQALM